MKKILLIGLAGVGAGICMMVLGAMIEHGAKSDSTSILSILGSFVILGFVAFLLIAGFKARDRRATTAVGGDTNPKQPGSWGAAIGGLIGSYLLFIIFCQVLPQFAPHTSHALGSIALFVVYPLIASLVVAGSLAPRRVLESPKVAALIGTKNPKVARILCIIAVIIFWVIIPCFFYWLAH